MYVGRTRKMFLIFKNEKVEHTSKNDLAHFPCCISIHLMDLSLCPNRTIYTFSNLFTYTSNLSWGIDHWQNFCKHLYSELFCSWFQVNPKLLVSTLRSLCLHLGLYIYTWVSISTPGPQCLHPGLYVYTRAFASTLGSQCLHLGLYVYTRVSMSTSGSLCLHPGLYVYTRVSMSFFYTQAFASTLGSQCQHPGLYV